MYKEAQAVPPTQGEGPPVCYYVKYIDCTAHGIGASKFPLLQQENLNIELLREVKHISYDCKIFILETNGLEVNNLT
jgi:hypothetical protein